MNKFILILITNFLCLFVCDAQYGYWQQEVDYKMDIFFDVDKNSFEGKQRLKYTNNSPEVLDRVFYHLYLNAFQPGSSMDERQKHLPDSDRRVGDRISKLKKKEMGIQTIVALQQDGKDVIYKVNGTILEVQLHTPIQPGSTTVLDMAFETQVPVQIRRTGRDNKEGVRYSMSQWYPKICEYDYMGWHPNPYIGREFHSPWGNFEVNITIDKDYVLGATGVLQNPNEVGCGYQAMDFKDVPVTAKTKTWRYKAENVIDFVWAADPDYTVRYHRESDGTNMYFVYQQNEKTRENWDKLPRIMDEAFSYINKRFGKYPFPQYSFIQGGDGGMEYPMATLITGERNLTSLVGVSIHELMHSWYQFMMATNEALYPWMDEGFTTFGTNETMNYLRMKGLIPGKAVKHEHLRSYTSYLALANSDFEEPLTTHADHYMTNRAYGIASYSKGNVFLNQMEYILGETVFAKALLDYYDTWKFKHPTSYDFVRIMEKNSGMVLDWYQEYFVNTIKTIDYAVGNVESCGLLGGKSKIELKRIGEMPMPLDVEVIMKNGEKHIFHIPLDLMRGAKQSDTNLYPGANYQVMKDWNWVYKSYTLETDLPYKKIASIDINPSEKLADVDPSNNKYPKQD